MAKNVKDARFDLVHLSFNIGAPSRQRFALGCSEDTQCGGVSNDCNGPSCDGSTREPPAGFDARILVARSELAALRAELQKVLTRFVR